MTIVQANFHHHPSTCRTMDEPLALEVGQFGDTSDGCNSRRLLSENDTIAASHHFRATQQQQQQKQTSFRDLAARNVTTFVTKSDEIAEENDRKASVSSQNFSYPPPHAEKSEESDPHCSMSHTIENMQLAPSEEQLLGQSKATGSWTAQADAQEDCMITKVRPEGLVCSSTSTNCKTRRASTGSIMSMENTVVWEQGGVLVPKKNEHIEERDQGRKSKRDEIMHAKLRPGTIGKSNFKTNTLARRASMGSIMSMEGTVAWDQGGVVIPKKDGPARKPKHPVQGQILNEDESMLAKVRPHTVGIGPEKSHIPSRRASLETLLSMENTVDWNQGGKIVPKPKTRSQEPDDLKSKTWHPSSPESRRQADARENLRDRFVRMQSQMTAVSAMTFGSTLSDPPTMTTAGVVVSGHAVRRRRRASLGSITPVEQSLTWDRTNVPDLDLNGKRDREDQDLEPLRCQFVRMQSQLTAVSGMTLGSSLNDPTSCCPMDDLAKTQHPQFTRQGARRRRSSVGKSSSHNLGGPSSNDGQKARPRRASIGTCGGVESTKIMPDSINNSNAKNVCNGTLLSRDSGLKEGCRAQPESYQDTKPRHLRRPSLGLPVKSKGRHTKETDHSSLKLSSASRKVIDKGNLQRRKERRRSWRDRSRENEPATDIHASMSSRKDRSRLNPRHRARSRSISRPRSRSRARSRSRGGAPKRNSVPRNEVAAESSPPALSSSRPRRRSASLTRIERDLVPRSLRNSRVRRRRQRECEVLVNLS